MRGLSDYGKAKLKFIYIIKERPPKKRDGKSIMVEYVLVKKEITLITKCVPYRQMDFLLEENLFQMFLFFL